MIGKRLIQRLFVVTAFFIIVGNLYLKDASHSQTSELSSVDDKTLKYPVMLFNEQTLNDFIEAYEKAPRVHISERALQRTLLSGGSVSLLDHMNYKPEQRNQGNCGNCWIWAGTGALEIALDVQEGIKDRLSIQYVNSCK